MAFPSTASGGRSLEDALKQLTSLAGAIKQRTDALIAKSVAGSVDGGVVISYLRDLAEAKLRLAERAATPGLPAYAKTQFDNAGLNLATEYAAMRDAIDATIAWFSANFPKDANGYLLYEQINGNGSIAYRSFSTPQLASLRTQLSLLSATIA